MGIKTQSMPFGSLSRATLDEAKSLLGDIKVAIEELHLVGREKNIVSSSFSFWLQIPLMTQWLGYTANRHQLSPVYFASRIPHKSLNLCQGRRKKQEGAWRPALQKLRKFLKLQRSVMKSEILGRCWSRCFACWMIYSLFCGRRIPWLGFDALTRRYKSKIRTYPNTIKLYSNTSSVCSVCFSSDLHGLQLGEDLGTVVPLLRAGASWSWHHRSGSTHRKRRQLGQRVRAAAEPHWGRRSE